MKEVLPRIRNKKSEARKKFNVGKIFDQEARQQFQSQIGEKLQHATEMHRIEERWTYLRRSI